jgi:hypothetical protein
MEEISMKERDLIDIINNSNLKDGNKVSDTVYHFYIVDRLRGNWEYVILVDNDVKVGVIVRWGHFDLYWLILEDYREKHYLSNLLRARTLKELWKENYTITCIKSYDEYEYSKTKHLAEIGGYEIKA